MCVCVCVCVCVFSARSTLFQSFWDGATASWVFTSTLGILMCLAQGHYKAVVGFEPWTSRSGVRISTTEPPRPLSSFVGHVINNFLDFYHSEFIQLLHNILLYGSLRGVVVKLLTTKVVGSIPGFSSLSDEILNRGPMTIYQDSKFQSLFRILKFTFVNSKT